jgi:hypothetical protein
MHDSTNTYPRLPAWAKEPLVNCTDYLENLYQMVDISQKSIHASRVLPELLKSLLTHLFEKDANSTLDEERTTFDKIKRATEQTGQDAKIAEREHKKGFPLLKGMAIVLSWGALETYVIDFLKAWLKNTPAAWETEIVKNLKVKLGEYLQMEDELKCEYVIEQIDKQLNGPLKQGIGRFEALLEAFNLSGPIDEDIRRNLFEMSKIRNAFVHNQGKADKRFIDSCPTLGYNVGDNIIGLNIDIGKFAHAVTTYISEIQLRIFEGLGFSREQLKDSPAFKIRYDKYDRKIVEQKEEI